MRYLFGFLCVCALGVVPMVGCGTPTHGSPCDDVSCDDGNECTWDHCDGISGVCRNPPVDDGTICAGGRCIAGQCLPPGSPLPCSEGGIRAAIRMGGGPVTFDCDGPQTVFSDAEIIIDTDVILDGGGKLIVNGSDSHRVFRIDRGVKARLVGIAVVGGKVYGENGGGILNEGSLTLVDSTLSGNEAISRSSCCGAIQIGCSCSHEGGSGGGLYNNGGTLTVTNSTVSGNSAGRGGGIFSWGAVTVINSTLSGNTANVCGGIDNQKGELALTGCTVSDNAAEYHGGGICNRAVLTLTNTTVSGNSASESDAIESEWGMLTLNSSTVFGDIRLDDTRAIVTKTIVVGECTPEVDEGGYNIESPGDTCGFDPDGTDLVDVSATELNLGPLANNGGPTQTHALLTDQVVSVAINRIPEEDCRDADGAPLATDQRGEPRPETGGTLCDVGAFERQPTDP